MMSGRSCCCTSGGRTVPRSPASGCPGREGPGPAVPDEVAEAEATAELAPVGGDADLATGDADLATVEAATGWGVNSASWWRARPMSDWLADEPSPGEAAASEVTCEICAG